MSPPLSVSPEAAFIAASAASQIVTNDHDSHADAWYDQHGIEPAGETALVSTAALNLVNNFLDQLLFNFLQISRETTLSALRPAVSEVLKPKLAKDAINQADEELREYLGGGDEDDFIQPRGADPSQDWDLELVWKRTRLRCMVYSSLGDLEEEDEDFYMEQEHLEPGDDNASEVISPAVAIFLTSILEYMGEQALIVAGQAAYHRLRLKYEKDLRDGVRAQQDIADRIVVEELDMERVALDRTLGRLWRAWKKRIRSPGLEHLTQRPFSRDSMRGSQGHVRQTSMSESQVPVRKSSVTDSVAEADEKTPTDADGIETPKVLVASDIPLPMGDYDIDEIEVPGLVMYSDEEDEDEEEEDDLPLRPKSMLVPTTIFSLKGLPTPTRPNPQSPVLQTRKRANSLPLPGSSSGFIFPAAKRTKVEPVSVELTSDATDPEKMSSETTLTDDGQEASVDDDDAEKSAETVAPEPKSLGSEKGRRAAADRLSKIITSPTKSGLAAVGAAAAATTVAGRVPSKQMEPEASDDEVEEEELVEEAEILTSSRVSIAGRSSPAISESGKAMSFHPGKLVRTPSVHSARLIDVAGPKSPVGSRTPSVETTERFQAVSLSRSSSTEQQQQNQKPAEPESTLRSSSTANQRSKSPIERISRPSRQNTAQSISEAEEDVEELSARGESTPTTATLSTPTSAALVPEEPQAQLKSSEAIFGSAVRHSSSPRQDHAHTGTKVTIVSTSKSNGPFVEDQPPEPPRKSPTHSRTVQPPAVPDRSANRQVNGHATSPSATSIGMVSVERQTARRESPELVRDEYAASTPSARPIHTSGSSGSSNTGRIKPVRTSEESGGVRSENVARNFEELIHSDQTIQYTLTPESMRDIEVSFILVPNCTNSSDALTLAANTLPKI
jgi:hypothetical protein